MKKYGVDQAVVTVVGYYFCDEPIPYRTTIAGKNVTLGQFKQHIAKKGNYRLVPSSATDIQCMWYSCFCGFLHVICKHSQVIKVHNLYLYCVIYCCFTNCFSGTSSRRFVMNSSQESLMKKSYAIMRFCQCGRERLLGRWREYIR